MNKLAFRNAFSFFLHRHYMLFDHRGNSLLSPHFSGNYFKTQINVRLCTVVFDVLFSNLLISSHRRVFGEMIRQALILFRQKSITIVK